MEEVSRIFGYFWFGTSAYLHWKLPYCTALFSRTDFTVAWEIRKHLRSTIRTFNLELGWRLTFKPNIKPAKLIKRVHSLYFSLILPYGLSSLLPIRSQGVSITHISHSISLNSLLSFYYQWATTQPPWTTTTTTQLTPPTKGLWSITLEPPEVTELARKPQETRPKTLSIRGCSRLSNTSRWLRVTHLITPLDS